jgi:hypothetical protein
MLVMLCIHGQRKDFKILWWFSGYFPAEERRSNSALTEPPPYEGGNNDKGSTYETKNKAKVTNK